MTTATACRLFSLNPAIFTVSGHPWLYLLWIGAFMTSHMLVTRIRQIAEHAAVLDQFRLDPRGNTRTLLINPIERFFYRTSPGEFSPGTSSAAVGADLQAGAPARDSEVKKLL
ncbi:MAG: hypothetical protein WD002_15075 [Pseudomonadales bacterium]